MDEPLLEMREITKYIYDSSGRPIRNSDVKILDSVSFDLRRGEVHVLVGENGAGKSTLMKILGGIIPPDQGTITLQGAAVSFASARKARDRGIAFIHQELNLCANLDVAHNIFLGREPRRRGLNPTFSTGAGRRRISGLGGSEKRVVSKTRFRNSRVVETKYLFKGIVWRRFVLPCICARIDASRTARSTATGALSRASAAPAARWCSARCSISAKSTTASRKAGAG